MAGTLVPSAISPGYLSFLNVKWLRYLGTASGPLSSLVSVTHVANGGPKILSGKF
jgi:hypothetical protein